MKSNILIYFNLLIENDHELKIIRNRFNFDKNNYTDEGLGVKLPMFEGVNFPNATIALDDICIPFDYIFDITEDDAALELWWRLNANMPIDRTSADETDFILNKNGTKTILEYKDNGLCGVSKDLVNLTNRLLEAYRL